MYNLLQEAVCEIQTEYGKADAAMNKQTIGAVIRFLFPFLLVLLVIGVLSQGIYLKSVKVLSEAIMEQQLSALENSMYTVEHMVSRAENLSVEFSLEPSFRTALLRLRNPTDRVYTYIDVWNTLNSGSFYRESILDYLIYFPEPRILMTSKALSITPELYYGDQIQYADLDFQQWIRKLEEADRAGQIWPAVELQLYGQKERVLSYVRELPFDLKNPPAVLQIFIPEQAVLDSFDVYVHKNQGLVSVLDPEGRLLTAKGDWAHWSFVFEEVDFDKQRDYFYLEPAGNRKWGDFLVYIKSPETGLLYLSILPEEILLQEVNGVRREILGISALMILIIALVGTLVTLRNVRSVGKISQKLRGFGGLQGGPGNPYSEISRNLDSLLESHDRLSVTFQEQASRIFNGITMDLLLGRCADLDQVLDHVEETGIRVRSPYYCTAVFKLMEQEDLFGRKQLLRTLVMQESRNDMLAADFSQERAAFLFCGEDSPETFEETVSVRLADSAEALRQHKLECFCIVGPVVDRVDRIHESTSAAVRAMSNILFEGGVTVYTCDSIYKDYVNLFYSVEAEQKIINMVRQGSRDAVMSFLENLIADRRTAEENVMKRKVFYLQLAETLNKIQGGNLEYSEFYKQLEQSNREQKIIQRLETAYANQADACLIQKKSGSSQLILEIQNYIREHYCDPSLCLAGIAQRFNISEVYFSQTFKSVTDENFSVYLENIRMEQARILLKTTGKTVEEVAGMVGYNSINTFHKAFKRVNGITPGAFKKLP